MKFGFPKRSLVFPSIAPKISFGGPLLIAAAVAFCGAGVSAQPFEYGEPDTPPELIEGEFVRRSESRALRPPLSLLDAEPITPYAGEPGPLRGDPRRSISFDVATRTESVDDVVPAAGGEDRTPGFEGLAAAIETFSDYDLDRSIIGGDDRVRITNTGVYPWRTVVRLGVRWTSTSGTGACSGAVISPYHVLTAGHCVFDYGGTDDWAFSIQVFPGLDDDEMPYNYAWATRYRSYTGWTDSGLTGHDWAVIALDRSIGSHTGWMGRVTAASGHSMYTGTANVAGYPGTPSGNATCPTWANCQYFDADSGHSATDLNHWYWMDTSGGMSGGPVWRYIADPPQRHIMTAHTCGTGGCGATPNGTNHGTRLNQDKFDRIPTWITADADITPNDRADLIDDGQPYSWFAPSLVAGGQAFEAHSDVRNVGTASSGGFYVSYYASTNTFISTSDYLIGNDYVGSISPFTWANSDLSVVFPYGIPDGTYYVGWIIDRFGDVSEFDEGNNSEYDTAGQLTVCNRAPTPSLLVPAPGALIEDRTPTLDWTSSLGANSYRLQVDDSPSFSSPLIDVTTVSSSYTPPSDLPYDVFYWRVRADKTCGTNGFWTSPRSFEIADIIFVDGFESGNVSAWSLSVP